MYVRTYILLCVHTTKRGEVLGSSEGDQSRQNLLPVGEGGTAGNVSPAAVDNSRHQLSTMGEGEGQGRAGGRKGRGESPYAHG